MVKLITIYQRPIYPQVNRPVAPLNGVRIGLLTLWINGAKCGTCSFTHPTLGAMLLCVAAPS